MLKNPHVTSVLLCFAVLRKLLKQHGKQLLFYIEKEMQSLTVTNAYVAIDFRRGWLSSKSRRN